MGDKIMRLKSARLHNLGNRLFAKVSFYIGIHDLRYMLSTFFLAQGVRLRNTRLDFMLGSFEKQFSLILRDISSHPYLSTRYVRIILSVTP